MFDAIANTTKKKLWKHQREALDFAIDHLAKRDSPCLIRMPTGTGKTGIIACLTRLSNQGSSLVLTPWAHLRNQMVTDLTKASSPGGGLNDDRLRVGGWGDQYYSLLRFDLAGLPANVTSAVLHLYCYHQDGGGTPMYLERITTFWDWHIQGTGRDRERLWWADRPSTLQWSVGQIPNPAQGQWYAVDITSLYNDWQDGTFPNYGLQLRPAFFFDNNFNEFYSSDFSDDSSLRPKLVIDR